VSGIATNGQYNFGWKSTGAAAVERLRIEVIDRVYAAILAAKTPAERAWMIGDCHRSARILLAAGERVRHPDWSDQQVLLEVSKRLVDGAD
jgi:hypothetical protein